MLFFKILRNVLWISVLCTLVGCGGGREVVLPEEGRTMLEIYESHMGSAGDGALRQPVIDNAIDAGRYTRTAQNEIEALFIRLPNPDLIMYVFPHLATEEGVPIPGYSTVFPMYERVIYALPGEMP